MIKLFVSDLDGTLINRRHEIVQYNEHAIKQAMDQGIHIAIASGRMSTEIKNLMKPFPANSFALGQNGATVYSKEHILLSSSQHEPKIAYEIMKLAMLNDELVTFVHTIHDEAYIRESNERTQQYEPRVLIPTKVMADYDEKVLDGTLPCSKVTFLGEITILQQLQEKLLDSFNDQIEVVISDYDCMDVTPLNVSKGRAVKLLMQQLGLSSDQVACIGDSYNDLSMFEVVGHSFAMKHSDEAIRNKANYVVDSVADAIGYCLHHLNS